MTNNLNRARPDEWHRGDLFPFIEECWSNSLAVVGNKNVVAARLTAIDDIFGEVVRQGLKPTKTAEIVPVLLYMRSFNAFRASVMVCLSLPTESFPLQRSCLENAGYARLIATDADLSALWLQRDENLAEVRKKFSNKAVRDAIAKDDEPLSKIYQEMYERSIDFGAHPNEKGVLGAVVPASINTGTLQVAMLAGDSTQLQHGLKSCAQVGICALKVFNLMFRTQFAKWDFETKIGAAARSF
ncbi:hypothetical protein [Bradyrhizobium sp. UNPF46]|uniref:hypothetical protein n=1 Tax=Bradyrhizobium sp. UNPF46 TaxID=1141168 RepID=UPI001151966D|nr:hypothetical protein [Bradyrhizobium sp. UNPF46]